ncbi:MAG: ubiquitin-like domain-containing protein [Promethearchaeota archaeon]
MIISVEDTRGGKIIKLDVNERHLIESIITIVVKHMNIITSEQRSFALIYNGKELPNSITIGEVVQNYGLKENDKLELWAKVIGG